MVLSKVIKATYKKGVSEPLEPVDFPEGAELLVTVEEAAVANQWFADLHRLFAPVRKEFTRESEATVERRVARAVKITRARKRGKT